jgi:acetyl-CoA C-acetyltransferase
MHYDGLVDAFCNYHMGITAENVARQYHVSREQQDEFALRSHQLAQQAWQNGKYDGDIVPVQVKQNRQKVEFCRDETYLEQAQMEYFTQAKPVFQEGGTVTGANASPLNDGAAVLLLAEEQVAKDRGLNPLARYVASAAASMDPAYMGYTPVFAVQKLLAKTGLSVSDIGLWEVNEAFASQAVAVCRDLALPMDRVNVNGGSIALGHPVGSTGARLVLTLIGEMQRRQAQYGIATLCIGGGQALATLFELV